MALAQSCVSSAQHPARRAAAACPLKLPLQLNGFAWEADVAWREAAACANSPDLLMCFEKGFWQARNQDPRVHDSTQVDTRVISTT